MEGALTVKAVRNIAYANYHRGGDYIIECYSDEDIRRFIANGGTKKSLYGLMESYEKIRAYFRIA